MKQINVSLLLRLVAGCGLRVADDGSFIMRNIVNWKRHFHISNLEEFRIDWLDSFIYTYLERDLPLLGFKASTIQMRRSWEMLA